MMSKYFGAHRYFYNEALDFVNDSLRMPSFIDIRNNVVINNKELTKETEWMSETPYDTRQLAVKNLLGSYRSGISNKRNRNIKNFNLKYLTKKDNNQVFYVNKKAFIFKNSKTKNGYYLFQRKFKTPLQFKKKMYNWLRKHKIEKSEGDFPVIKDSSDRYYLCLNFKTKNFNRNEKEIKKESIVALDPGVRTFQTYYSEKECGKIGHEFHKKIKPLFSKLDKLESLVRYGKTKHNVKRRCTLLRTKITNKIKDLHCKAANFLTKRYKVILIPVFKTQNIAKKSDNKWLNRYMLQLAHYKFREAIINSSVKNNSTVLVCQEPWTSKTCGNCGKISDIGSSKIYNCPHCKKIIDRDVNGARNILVRFLTKYFE